MFKKMFQSFLFLFLGREKRLAYVRNHCLSDSFVDELIEDEKKRYLLKEYVKYHTLKEYQILRIIKLNDEISLKQEVLKKNVLSDDAQVALVNNNNVLLLETYLCPDGYYQPERTFSLNAEYLFLSGLIEKNALMGFEVFKTYVANNTHKALTKELLMFIIYRGYDNELSRHILLKSKLSREMEDCLVNEASDEQLKFYLENRQIYSDSAQMCLINRSFELATLHNSEYGLRPKAKTEYYRLKKQEFEKSE